jgi:hypothetical protein
MLQSVFTDVAPCLPMLPQCSLNVGVHEVLMLQFVHYGCWKVDPDVSILRDVADVFQNVAMLFLNVAYFFFMLHAT